MYFWWQVGQGECGDGFVDDVDQVLEFWVFGVVWIGQWIVQYQVQVVWVWEYYYDVGGYFYCFFDVVGDYEDGGQVVVWCMLQVDEFLMQVFGGQYVQCVEGFVQVQQFGFGYQCMCNVYVLVYVV